MRKGLIIALAALLVIALGATWSFAESPSQGMMNTGYMNEMHKKMVEQHVKDGVLTPEQAKAMDGHMANMGSMMSSMTGQGMMGDTANCHFNQQGTDTPKQ